MSLQVAIQKATDDPVPDEEDIRGWIAAALDNAGTRPIRGRSSTTEVTVRVVGIEEMSRLNEDYRGVTGPTNVLSFPAELPEELQHPLLGDIVICAPVVRSEALRQNMAPAAHWAHLAIHGTLHLLGYDHILPGEADVMEALESAIMLRLGYACPYGGAETVAPAIR